MAKSRKKKRERELMINSGAAGQPGALDRMAEITGEIRNLQRFVRTMERQFAEMTLVSPIAGTVLETPYQYQTSGPGEVEDVDQHSLLYGKHDNVSAQRGQRFCEVADLSKWYAVVILNEHQVKFAQIDQPTKIKLYAQPKTVLESTVESIGETDLSIDRTNFEVPGRRTAWPRITANSSAGPGYGDGFCFSTTRAAIFRASSLAGKRIPSKNRLERAGPTVYRLPLLGRPVVVVDQPKFSLVIKPSKPLSAVLRLDWPASGQHRWRLIAGIVILDLLDRLPHKLVQQIQLRANAYSNIRESFVVSQIRHRQTCPETTGHRQSPCRQFR